MTVKDAKTANEKKGKQMLYIRAQETELSIRVKGNRTIHDRKKGSR